MTPFEEFQREEYGKIAEAHFKTIESISAFFRYYLILMALPLTLVGAFVTVAARATVQAGVLEQLMRSAKSSVGLVFIVIGVLGFFIMLYVVHLRFDALLYARTVNAIRKFFYDKADEGFLQKARMRTLPQTAFAPPYYEKAIFTPVVIVFAIFNTLYLYLGWIFVVDRGAAFLPGEAVFNPPIDLLLVSAVFFATHIVAYRRDADNRETQYLRRSSIGIDIDGVLNRHRQHFAAVLKAKGGPDINPDTIVFLPVRDDPSLGVTRAQEIEVFNSPEYWTDMIPDPEAGYYVRALRDMGLEIHLVTNRPWPDLRRVDKDDRPKVNRSWSSTTQKIISRCSEIERLWLTFICMSLRSKPAIEVLTKDWLRRHDIPFDSLTIERSVSTDGVHHSLSTKSRVQIAQKHALKFFVEDDWESAYRLAFICDVVFLIRHPYNEAMPTREDLFRKGRLTEPLPGNVVVVDGWSKIHRAIKQLM